MENFLFFSVILDTCLGDSLLKMACLLFRELLKGPLYYAFTITWACFMYWRTSPIAIASICNLCAGDGIVSRTIFVYVFFFCLVRFGFLHAAWLFKHIYTYTPKYWTQIYIKVLNSFTAPFRYGRYCGEAFRKSETSLQQQQNNYWHCRYGNCWFLGLHRVTHIASGDRNISQNLLGFLLMETSKQIHVLFLLLWIHSRKHGGDSRVLERVPCFCSRRIPSTEHQSWWQSDGNSLASFLVGSFVLQGEIVGLNIFTCSNSIY